MTTQAEHYGKSADKTLGGGDPVFTVHRGARFWRISAANGKVLLPDATKYKRTGGPMVVILNTSAATFDIKDNDDSATVVSALAQDEAAVLYLSSIDTAAGDWHAMVLDNADASAGAVSAEMVFIGGLPNPEETHTFNDSTRAWTAETDALGDRKQASAARTPDGSMVIQFGTFEPSGDRAKTDRYTVATDAWVNRLDKATDGYRTAAAGLDSGAQTVYLFGGTIDDTDADAFREGLNTWTSVDDMPTGRAYCSACHLTAEAAGPAAEMVAVFGGGSSPNTAGDDTETVDINLSSPNTWTTRTKIPPPARGHHDCAEVNGKAYLVAGATEGDNPLDDVNQYNSVTDTFAQRARLAVGARYDGVAVAGNDRLYYAGGETTGPTRYDDVSEYLETLDSWISATALPAVKSEWANQGG